jgi:hypothetical protein
MCRIPVFAIFFWKVYFHDLRIHLY